MFSKLKPVWRWAAPLLAAAMPVLFVAVIAPGFDRSVAAIASAVSASRSAALPSGVLSLFPAQDATLACADPSLRIAFPSTPVLGTSGKVRVFKDDGTLAATVDMGVASTIDHIGGARITLTRRAFVDGNVAIFYLPQHALAYDQTYHVTIDPGVITSPASFSVSGNKTWRFRTGARPAGSATLTVDLTGGAEYCSVQGAFDSIPTNNTAATTVTINDGTYHEIVNVSRKNNLTVRGQSRKGTVLAETSNQLQNPNFRGVVNADNLSGLTIANLTLHNLTPLGGSQAEALTLRLCTHCIVRDADILSYQDTFSAWGTVYVDNAYIEGSVDFIWGGASTYIKDSHIHVVSRGYTAWARNGPDAYGIVFVDSTFTAGPGVYLHWLARTSADFPYSNVAYIDSTMGDFFTPQGWHVKEGTPTDNLRFWEYRSRDPEGNLIDVSQRAPFSRQLTHAEAAKLRNPATVLGGWVPDAAAAGAPP